MQAWTQECFLYKKNPHGEDSRDNPVSVINPGERRHICKGSTGLKPPNSYLVGCQIFTAGQNLNSSSMLCLTGWLRLKKWPQDVVKNFQFPAWTPIVEIHTHISVCIRFRMHFYLSCHHVCIMKKDATDINERGCCVYLTSFLLSKAAQICNKCGCSSLTRSLPGYKHWLQIALVGILACHQITLWILIRDNWYCKNGLC